jgi:hypothetical protein
LEPSPPQQVEELSPPPHDPVEEGQAQGSWGEEGCSQDGDGAPPGHDGVVACLLTGCLVRDPLTATNGNVRREKNLHTTLKQKAQSLSDYAQQDLSVTT